MGGGIGVEGAGIREADDSISASSFSRLLGFSVFGIRKGGCISTSTANLSDARVGAGIKPVLSVGATGALTITGFQGARSALVREDRPPPVEAAWAIIVTATIIRPPYVNPGIEEEIFIAKSLPWFFEDPCSLVTTRFFDSN